jgi:hypothetical protein
MPVARKVFSNPCLDDGRFRAPADDAVGILLEEGIGGKLAGLAAGGAEERAVDVTGDGRRFNVTRADTDRDDGDKGTSYSLPPDLQITTAPIPAAGVSKRGK